VTNSFEYIADRWLANRSAAGKRSLKHDVGRLKNYVYPSWGARDISTITRRDVFTLLEDVQARVIKDRGYGIGVNANRVGSLIKSIFAFALDREVITTNPASGVKPLVAEQARKLELSSEQTRAAFRATRGISDPRLRDYFTLLWLTGARCGEIAKSRWQDVDFNASVLRIPKENTKGKVNWSIPLSEPAMVVLRARKSSASGELVFDGPRPLNNLNHYWKRLVKDPSGVELRLHDIRSLAVSQMARWQVPEILLDIVLGHSVGKSIVAKNYLSYRFEAEHRVALSRWARWLNDEQAELTAGAIAALVVRTQEQQPKQP